MPTGRFTTHAASRSPRLALGAALALLAPMVVLLATPAASGDETLDELEPCSVSPAPCVLSVSQNGGPLDAGVSYYVGRVPSTGDIFVFLDGPPEDDFQLPEAVYDDTFEVVVQTAGMPPRVVHGRARDTMTSRALLPGGQHQITVAGKPVTMSGSCTGSGYCPEEDVPSPDDPEPHYEQSAVFNFVITDYSEWDDAAQRDAFYGLDYFTNVSWGTIPPEVRYFPDVDAEGLYLELANRRFMSDLSTLFIGAAEVRIPHKFLQVVYGVPNPATMNSGSVGVSGASGSATLTQFGSYLQVNLDDLTFARASAPILPRTKRTNGTPKIKKVKIKRGTITPTRVKKLKATRVGKHKAKLKFGASSPRGANVKGYQATCEPKRGGSKTRRASAGGTTIKVKKLKSGVPYTCKVRAKSKVGPGAWTKKKVNGRP